VCGLDIGSVASAGCELRSDHESHAPFACFRCTKPAASRVLFRSQAGALLVPPVLNTSAHFYQHTHAAACGLNTDSETGVSELSFRSAVL